MAIARSHRRAPWRARAAAALARGERAGGGAKQECPPATTRRTKRGPTLLAKETQRGCSTTNVWRMAPLRYMTPPILRPCCCGCVRRSVVWLRPAPPCSPPPLVASNFPIPHLAEVEGLRQDIISAQLWCGSSPLRSAAAASAACARHGPRGACRRRHEARHAPRPHRCARVSHARARLSLSPSLSVRPHNWPLHAL